MYNLCIDLGDFSFSKPHLKMSNITITLAELTDTHLQDFKEAKAARIIHLFNKDYAKGGITVGYYPLLSKPDGYPVGIFAEVAFAYCKPSEMYSRRLGEQLVLRKLYDGNSSVMPIYVTGHPFNFIKNIFADYAY